ncbi:MAG: hypothetical protein M3Q12_04655 [Pseudomonadota bacterium]|nr:hypothetical protein [Pseudomonadota bacterium]
MPRTSCLLLALLVGSGLAAAQNAPPASNINRNPAYREPLPPNPVAPPDVRDTVVQNPGPGDPRDSDTRPVQPPASRDGRDAPSPAPTSTGPTNRVPVLVEPMRR